ncbi:MAG: TetR family transcriptional regulator [Ramlibacter sp.]|nr:TetR family transcriptional regulator [Ramlibacter sp.]
MARTKEFDRDVALGRAIATFAQHGFEGTSTEALVAAMDIRRQSLYDTFGDKWRLYLEALQRYSSDSIGAQLVALEGAPTGAAGIEALLLQAAARAADDPQPACLGISSICEFGRSEPEVTALNETMGRLLTGAVERRVREAVAAGAFAASLDAAVAAQFVLATLTGIRVAARQGASVAVLRGIADMAMRSFR